MLRLEKQRVVNGRTSKVNSKWVPPPPAAASSFLFTRYLLWFVRPIAEGVVVGFYTGEVLTLADLDARYPDFEGSEYVMQVGPDRYLDARDPEQSGITRRETRGDFTVVLVPLGVPKHK